MSFSKLSPLQDEEARRIYSHVNRGERAQLKWYGQRAGLFFAFMFSMISVLSFAAWKSILSLPTYLILVVIVIIALVWIGRAIRRHINTFLQSTDWAKKRTEQEFPCVEK